MQFELNTSLLVITEQVGNSIVTRAMFRPPNLDHTPPENNNELSRSVFNHLITGELVLAIHEAVLRRTLYELISDIESKYKVKAIGRYPKFL